MHSKNNRQNHDFQIAYFLAGSCKTPDAAYALLADQRDDRDVALKNFKASELKQRAKIIRAERKLESDDEAERLEGEAELEEIKAFEELTAKNVAAAKAELAFIDRCLAAIEPHRKFKHLPLPEANEACQREEWMLEFIERAENQLLTTNTISHDDYAHMRRHPDFETQIAPSIVAIQELLGKPGGRDQLLKISASKTFDLPKLLIGDDKEKILNDFWCNQ